MSEAGDTKKTGLAGTIWQFLFKIHLVWYILIFSVFGIILGFVAPAFSKDYLSLLSTSIFLPMLKTLIVPIIFSLLVIGIAGHANDIKTVGRLGAKSLAYFITLTVIALFIGLGFANAFQPGAGIRGTNKHPDNVTTITLKTVIEKAIPNSFFAAAADNQSLQVTFCAVMFGWATLIVKKAEDRRTLVDFFQAFAHVILEVVNLVMRFTPLAIMGSLAKTVATLGPAGLATLGKLIGTVYIGLAVFVLVVFVPIMLFCKVPFIPFLKAVREPTIIAFTTASSDAALALALENMIKLGVPTDVASFVIPTGYAFNLDGTTLYLGSALLFIVQANGLTWDFGQQFVAMLTVLLMSKGIAGVPRASLVILAAACKTYGLDDEYISVILGVDEIMDMARTSVNLVGNCLACVVMAKWEGKFVLYGNDAPTLFENDLNRDKPADDNLEVVHVVEDGPLETEQSGSKKFQV